MALGTESCTSLLKVLLLVFVVGSKAEFKGLIMPELELAFFLGNSHSFCCLNNLLIFVLKL